MQAGMVFSQFSNCLFFISRLPFLSCICAATNILYSLLFVLKFPDSSIAIIIIFFNMFANNLYLHLGAFISTLSLRTSYFTLLIKQHCIKTLVFYIDAYKIGRAHV